MAGRPKGSVNKTSKTIVEKKTDDISTTKINDTIKTETLKVKKELPMNMLVPVINATQGHLIYISKRQVGYKVEWEKFGDVEHIELIELQSMRSSQRSFFEKNWIFIDDKDVLEFLRVEKYYKNIPTIDKFDSVFKLSPAEITTKISTMSEGMKTSIAARAKELINSGELDSMKIISAIQSATGYNFDD